MLFKFLCFFLFPILVSAEVGYVEPWGKDSDLRAVQIHTQPAAERLSILSKAMLGLIHFHQTVITQIDGPRSHFRPSSSQYMREAIRKYGFLQGFAMGCDRLLRENGDPWIYRTRLIGDKLYKWDPPN